MPPNLPNKVKQYRDQYARLKGTRFENQTDYKVETQKLQKKGIPVHAFYITNEAKASFEEIAEQTKGKSMMLNVNDQENGRKLLLEHFTKQILMRVGDENGGIGVKLVKAFEQERFA